MLQQAYQNLWQTFRIIIKSINSFPVFHKTSIWIKCWSCKGQLISKCPFGVIVWTKIATKKFDNFCPGGQIKKIKALFYINYGVFNVIKCLFFIWPPGQTLSNFFVAILVQTMTPKGHFEISWPLRSWYMSGTYVLFKWILLYILVHSVNVSKH